MAQRLARAARRPAHPRSLLRHPPRCSLPAGPLICVTPWA